jgi:hypothetical protein
MKHHFVTLFTTALFCAAVTARALAGVPSADTPRDWLVWQLEQRAQQLDWYAHDQKGIGREQLEEQSLQVKDLIERLNAGEAVDPHEIDQLLTE